MARIPAFILLFLLSAVSSSVWCAETGLSSGPPSIVETYPHLKDLTFKEPKSDFYFGFGLSPVGILRGRMMFAVDFFQIHWIRDFWDIELLGASYGVANAQPDYLSSRHFIFRTSPKIRFFKVFSVGPVLGYEFVSYPAVDTKLTKPPWETPHWEPFSSKGVIYGIALSQTFPIWTDYILKLTQFYIRQTYSAEKTDDDWEYLYQLREIRNDRSGIEADSIISIGISLLF